jgi:hypothetical protein
MSASASHADAPTLDETVAEVQRTFRDARAHTAVKRGEAAAALQEVEAQVRLPVPVVEPAETRAVSSVWTWRGRTCRSTQQKNVS